MREPLTGLVAAPLTPMHGDGQVDFGKIEKQADWLVRCGVRGAFACGTTGEGFSLTLDERRRIAERWVAVRPKGLAVIVHVGHTCLADSRALAAHAEKIGADAIACMAPCFFRPSTLEALVAYSAEVAAAAPGLAFYYYHIPAMTGVTIPVCDFLQAGARRIPTLAGAKFTYESLMDFHRCLALEGGRFNMLFGRDEILLSALVLGTRGAVGTTYNFAAPLYLRIMKAYESGDIAAARKEQLRAADMITIMNKYGGVPAAKAMMKMIGLDCGPVRLPLASLTGERYEACRKELEQLGFFDWGLAPA